MASLGPNELMINSGTLLAWPVYHEILHITFVEDENRPTIRAAFNRVKGKPEETPAESKKDKSPPKKMVSINDFFGGGTVHRVERPTPSSATKRKAVSDENEPARCE